MQSIELIRRNLERGEEIVLARIGDMREACLVAPTPRGGAHTLWVLGHLAFIEAQVVRGFMRGEPNPYAGWEQVFDGEDVSGRGSDFPPFDEVLGACREERSATLSLLGTLAEEDLDRDSLHIPEGAHQLFGTWRDCLQYAADHWLMHRGQLADARRAAGIGRSWY